MTGPAGEVQKTVMFGLSHSTWVGILEGTGGVVAKSASESRVGLPKELEQEVRTLMVNR